MHHQMPAVVAETLAKIEKATVNWLETGIIEIEDAWPREDDETGPSSAVAIRSMLRRAAKDMKRPQVVAEHVFRGGRGGGGREWNHTTLTVPRTKRTETLITALFLASSDVTTRHAPQEDGVFRRQNGTNTMFTFRGDDARTVYDSFINQCRTDPIFRVCLRAGNPTR